MAGLETFHSRTAGPARHAARPSPAESTDSIVSGVATSLIESTPYLSPGAAGRWCQHLGSREILLVTGSFTRSGSQACKARLGPAPPLSGILPSVGKSQLLGCLCHTLCLLLLLSQPCNEAHRKYRLPWPAPSAWSPCPAQAARTEGLGGAVVLFLSSSLVCGGHTPKPS